MNFRRAVKSDSNFLLSLRNEPSVRMKAFNSNPISSEEHKIWFEKKLMDKNSLIIIAEEDGVRIGQIRFERDKKNKNAEVDIALLPAFRGLGHGSKILEQGCKIAFDSLGIKNITAHIIPENEASKKSFSRAGFLNEKKVFFKKRNCIEMSLKKK